MLGQSFMAPRVTWAAQVVAFGVPSAGVPGGCGSKEKHKSPVFVFPLSSESLAVTLNGWTVGPETGTDMTPVTGHLED